MASPGASLDPHYQRIRRQLEMHIRRGTWHAGDRIPGEREIARQAGVSQMTVNRAIQELVRAGWLVRKVGSGTFVSGTDAQPTAEKTLVLAAPFTGNPEDDVYLRSPFNAIRQSAAAVGASLVVVEVPEGVFAGAVDRYPHAAFIFAAPSDESHAGLCALHGQGVPFVSMGASWPDAPFACEDTDNYGGARTAVEYLLRLGHERIAFVNGVASAPNCRDRQAGYLSALADHGIVPQTAFVVQSGSNWELGDQTRRDITALLLQVNPVTAIFCAGYYIALGVYSLVNALSLHIPGDVSVVGFDDPRSAAHLSPPLTTIRQPLTALGECAVRRALNLLDHPVEEQSGVSYLPVELVIRGSCVRRT